MPACGACDAPGCMCAWPLPAVLFSFAARVPGPPWLLPRGVSEAPENATHEIFA